METWWLVMDLSHSRAVYAIPLKAGHAMASFWDCS